MMKKIILISLILWGSICQAQVSAYQYSFFLPSEFSILASDGSDLDWTATNKTINCVLHKSDAAVAFTLNVLIGFSAGEWESTMGCQGLAVGNTVEMVVTVVNPASPLYGVKLRWEGQIDADGSEDVYMVMPAFISATGKDPIL